MVVGVGLPLNFTKSKYIQNINLGINTAFAQVSGYDLKDRTTSLTGNGNFNAMIYTFSYSALLKRATREVAPKWGFTANYYKRILLPSSVLDAGITSYQAGAYFPGILKNHSLRIRWAYQNQEGYKNNIGSPNTKLYLFSSPTFFPRGYSYRGFENLTTFSAEYRFPVIDPDLVLGRFLYIKRIKANLFADNGYGFTKYNWTEIKDGKLLKYSGSDIKNYTSLGIDLTAQFHFLRFSQQFDVGFRAIYLTDKGQFQIQPLIVDIGF
jgi:hypothetical protein